MKKMVGDLIGRSSVSVGAALSFGSLLPETAPGRAPFGVCVDSVFGKDECAELVTRAEPNFASLSALYPRNYRNHSSWDVFDEDAAKSIFQRLEPLLPQVLEQHGNVHTPTSPIPNLAMASWNPIGCNPLLRFSRYAAGEQFPAHLDGHYRPNDKCESLWSVLIYLNCCDGGETLFFDSSSPKARVVHSIAPKTGRVAIFDHDVWHAGAAPQGTKYILRSDVVFEHVQSVYFDSDAARKLERIRDSASALFRAPRSAERDYASRPAVPFALLHHSNYIMGASLTTGGLLTASRDRTIALWQDGRVVRSFAGHRRSVLVIIIMLLFQFFFQKLTYSVCCVRCAWVSVCVWVERWLG